MSDCVFCSFIQTGAPHHEKVWEDAHHVAFLTIEPAAPGHTLVVPKAHTEYVFSMESDAMHSYMGAITTVATLLKQSTGKERVALTFEGFSVPHVHAHLIPENRGDDCLTFATHKATSDELRREAEKLMTTFSV